MCVRAAARFTRETPTGNYARVCNMRERKKNRSLVRSRARTRAKERERESLHGNATQVRVHVYEYVRETTRGRSLPTICQRLRDGC